MGTIETATFAAGCFWGVEAEFASLPGVTATTVGYTGGRRKSPSYEQVCSGATGHAEAVLVEFDPEQISYEQLVDVFWKVHDPTQLNRQGPDIGSQYRSVIFTHSSEQAEVAKRSLRSVQSGFNKPIVTQIVPAEEFWDAEDHHQDYFAKRGIVGSCRI